jgi:hypothetical protein
VALTRRRLIDGSPLQYLHVQARPLQTVVTVGGMCPPPGADWTQLGMECGGWITLARVMSSSVRGSGIRDGMSVAMVVGLSKIA